MRLSIVDLLIVALAILFAINGYRQGFVTSALSFVGFLGGAALGAQLASPIATTLLSEGTGQVVVAVVIVLFCAFVGQIAAIWLGNQLRERMTWRPARVADSAGGAALSALAVLLVAWMVGTPLASSPYPGLASAVRRSEVIHAVDGAVPGTVRELYQSLRDTVRRGDFPEVFGPLVPTQVADVPEPDRRLLRDPAVAADRPSILKVTGVAFSCGRRIEGSGFVFAPERLITNAHVVAGVGRPYVEVNGQQLASDVVLYDPNTDLAVLRVPGLAAKPLKFASSAARSRGDAIIAGYPEDGPFFVGAARIRDVQRIRGPNIYSTRTVVREVYAIRGDVRSGNSGGPLLAPDGSVYGVIFAAAVDQKDTGFALTDREIADEVEQGRTASVPVDTGPCD